MRNRVCMAPTPLCCGMLKCAIVLSVSGSILNRPLLWLMQAISQTETVGRATDDHSLIVLADTF